ncbi:TetR/AcrR family transcriptional regulator [Paenibacillus endoradicis]|uniref:TetR/AcrR family transcriptional regulator n=1 Tax=Paenibacillus endoradicis TaxID=2972487 RepID=UPI002159A39C|nr:TetR/AcrR family transcriptional regulator [Paenibacillus endoradicis]MCR8660240.1 TetR/AcrR family transcriptional regulator [Paenibacillus endoradicis]
MVRVVKQPEERKEELLGVAIKLFMEKGYVHTSVKDIYMAVNGSFGMFYYHFKSKEEIFEAAMAKYTDQFVKEISDILQNTEIPFEQRYQLVFSHWLELILGRDKVRGTQHDVEVFRILSGKMLSGAIHPVTLYIDEGIKRGLMITDNSRQSAIVLVYGLFGLTQEERNRLSSNENASHIFAQSSKLVSLLLGADEKNFRFKE